MDSFFGIGVFELVFIIIFALIFLGPERLPGVLRQIIGVIRQVRDLTADVTRQFNDEFGDLAELDPRRQIQKALNETTSDIKDATKPVSKALNKPAAKTTSNTAAKPATTPKPTPKPTAARATTDVAAAAESSVDSADVTVAAAAKAATLAEKDNDESTSASIPSPDTTQVEAASELVDGDEKSSSKPRSITKQPSADDQISPASAYFAEKAARPTPENASNAKPAGTAPEDAFGENTIAPPSAAQQVTAKDVTVSEAKPVDEDSTHSTVDEATAEEKSL